MTRDGLGDVIETLAAESLARDLAACRRQHKPSSAEGHQALAICLPGPRVLQERIQRVAVVGHLPLSVRTADRADLGSVYATPGGRFSADPQRWPELRAFV